MLAAALAFAETAQARDAEARSRRSQRIADRRNVALVELLGRDGVPGSHEVLSIARAERAVETRRSEIELLLREMSSAYQHSDLAVAAALVDFPFVILKAAASGGGWVRSLAWSSEEWLDAVEPRFNGAPTVEGRHIPVISMITDSLAWVEDDRLAIAGEGADERALVIKRGRRWLVKALVERRAPTGEAGARAPVGHIGRCASAAGAAMNSTRRPCPSR